MTGTIFVTKDQVSFFKSKYYFIECHFSFLDIRSRISLKRTASSDGSTAAGSGMLSSFFRRNLLMIRMIVKITSAISRKLMIFWMNLP